MCLVCILVTCLSKYPVDLYSDKSLFTSQVAGAAGRDPRLHRARAGLRDRRGEEPSDLPGHLGAQAAAPAPEVPDQNLPKSTDIERHLAVCRSITMFRDTSSALQMFETAVSNVFLPALVLGP